MVIRKDARSYVPGTRSYTSSTGYQPLSQDDDGFTDAQFTQPRKTKRIPWKAIGYAILLFTAGTLMLVIGSLLVTGYIDEKYADRTWPVIILGALMFIPGAYHSYIAYYAFKGYSGYSFDDIPSYDDD